MSYTAHPENTRDDLVGELPPVRHATVKSERYQAPMNVWLPGAILLACYVIVGFTAFV